jgi:hypothetical protein
MPYNIGEAYEASIVLGNASLKDPEPTPAILRSVVATAQHINILAHACLGLAIVR